MINNSKLIVRWTKLTHLFTIDNKSIKYFTMKRKIIGTEIKVYLAISGNEKYFQFRTKFADKWVKCFSNIGIYEQK